MQHQYHSITGKIFTISTGALTICILILSIIRIFYGIEITDEIFIISESVLVNSGATPFVDNWSQTPGFVLLARLPAIIWNIFKTDFEGIFLFYRISFLIFKIFLLGACCFLLVKSKMQKTVSYISVLVLVPFYIYIPNFHYNNISVFMLLLLGCILIYVNGKAGVCAFTLRLVSGCLMALCIYMHPSDFLGVAMLLADIAICESSSNKKKAIFEVCLGGILTGMTVTLWMVERGGGFAKLLYGLDSVLNYNAYFKLPVNSFWNTTTELSRFSRPFVLILLGIIILKNLWNVIFKRAKCSNIMCGIFFLLVSAFYTLRCLRGTDIENACGIILVLYLFYRFKDIKSNNSIFRIYVYIFLPLLFSCISIGYLSYGSAVSRLVHMLPCILVVLQDVYKSLHGRYRSKAGLLVCAIAFSSIVIRSNYSYIYRDEAITKLTCLVETGIYKGVYTTPAKKSLYEELEKYLYTAVDSEKSVLFMEVVPMAYLMTDAKYCAPSTWDIMLYSYGFNDDVIMQRYFESIGQLPDYIVYIDTGRDACVSVEKEDYMFTKFVLSNYEKQSEITLGNSLDVVMFSLK